LTQGEQLEAVIGLPPNLFYSTTIPACLLIFQATKPKERLGHVLFVDGSARFEKGRSQNQISTGDIEAIVRAYRSGTDPDGEGDGVAVRLVGHAEIAENDWDLNIGRYIKTAVATTISVDEALSQLRAAQSGLREAEAQLDERLRAAGYA
jgi:type I restriction enzyme M protein